MPASQPFGTPLATAADATDATGTPAETAAPSDTDTAPADATDVSASRARLVLPELHRATPEEPAAPIPAPPTYAEMEHLLRDLH